MVMSVLLLVAISTHGRLVLTGAAEEKASRVVEVLLARMPALPARSITRAVAATRSGLPSRAGRRVVSFPKVIAPDLREHLDGLGPAASLVFTSPDGTPMRHSNYRRMREPALAAVGLPGVHFHDLRHTGNQFSADAGANLRELMEHMGPRQYESRSHLPAHVRYRSPRRRALAASRFRGPDAFHQSAALRVVKGSTSRDWWTASR